MSLNRLLIVLLILVLLGTGGAAGYWWWKDQPKQLLAAADQYYKQGEAQLESNPTSARQAFLKADERLERLLDVKKDPRNSAAALKRYEVQTQLIRLYRKDEGPDAQVLLARARAEAGKCAQLAAADKKNYHAQALLLNLAFRVDDLRDALTYAENLLDSDVERNEDLVKKYPTELAAAHFLKGRAALAAEPPRPDETLNHVKACQEIKKKTSGSDEKQRWREIDLEARALQEKAKEAKVRGPGPKGTKDDSMAVLLARIPEWIKRAQNETKEIAVPAAGKTPDQSLIVLLHSTNMLGLFSFLTLSIELAPTPEDVAERANLILDFCDALIAGRFLSPKALKDVNTQLDALPKTLKSKLVVERYEKLPQETRDKLGQRIEELTKKNKEAGAVMDAALYAQLAQDACDECRWDAAEALAFEGLHIAADRKLVLTDPAVADLHASAARVLLLKNNLMTPKNISLRPANECQPAGST